MIKVKEIYGNPPVMQLNSVGGLGKINFNHHVTRTPVESASRHEKFIMN